MAKYYNNDENCGLVYDWAAVAKEFAGLKAPAGYYDPLAALANGARWNVAASVRSVGKTTSVLLLGMILNKIYGTSICYLRSRDSEIAQSLSEELFNTICSYDHGRYITYCTNGYYNSVYYKWRKLYYCRRDDEGNVIERMQQPFVYFLSLDKWKDYKSTLNVPRGDLFIWDECIGDSYDNDFVKFCDIQKTILRDRLSGYFFLLCNTINVTAPIFRDLEISKQITSIRPGYGRMCYTSRNQKIWVDMCDVILKRQRAAYNDLYMGFSNPKLNAITGDDSGWAFDCVPHIDREPEKELINRDISISYHGEMLGVDIMRSPSLGPLMEVHPISKRRKIIFVLDDVIDRTELRGLPRRYFNTLNTYERRGLMHFSDNLTGHIYAQFMKETPVI